MTLATPDHGSARVDTASDRTGDRVLVVERLHVQAYRSRIGEPRRSWRSAASPGAGVKVRRRRSVDGNAQPLHRFQREVNIEMLEPEHI